MRIAWPTPTPRPSPAKPRPRPTSQSRRLAGQAGRGVSARRNDASARPRRRCWRRRTGPWPRRRWPRPSASRRNAAPPSKRRPRPRRRRIIVEAEAEAEKRRIEAEGEAAAIFAKLEAEARGQYEILAKKGEGLQAHHRGVRRLAAGLPDAHARTPRQAGRDGGHGHLEHQVRQGHRVGKRRATATATAATRPTSCKAWPGRCRP